MTEPENGLKTRARFAARGAELVAATAAAGIAGSLAQKWLNEPRRDEQIERYRRWWAGRMLHAAGAQVELARGAPGPAAGARLVVANHRSMLDTPLLLRLFGGHFLSQVEVSRMPVLGTAARASGAVFVDRTNPNSRVSAIRAMRRLLDAGRTLIVFPEGTTFLGDEVRAFQTGAFILSQGVEVIPVGLAYDHHSAEFGDETLAAHATRVAGRPRTRVTVAIGAPLPISTRGRGAAQALAAQAREVVQGLVEEARAVNPRRGDG